MCKFCEGSPTEDIVDTYHGTINRNGTTEVWIDSSEKMLRLLTVISGYIVVADAEHINFCPMCGREL